MDGTTQVFYAVLSAGGAPVAYYNEDGVPVSDALIPADAVIVRPGDEGYRDFASPEAA